MSAVSERIRKNFEALDLRPFLRRRTPALRTAVERMFNRFLPGMEFNIVRVLWHRRRWRKLANFLLVELQMRFKNTRALGKPYWLTVDPTNFCQLRCPFCPTGSQRQVRAKAILKIEDYKKVLDVLGPTLIHIDFMNWGEPLLHPELFEMIAYAKKYGVDTLLSTNLNEFDEKRAEAMVLSGLDAVILSIDGLTQQTYSKYRVRGDYDKVISNLRTLVRKKAELKRSNPYIIWQFLVFKHNEHEVERVNALAKSLGADTVGITPAFMPFKPGIKDEWLPTKPEYRYYDPERFPDAPPWEWSAQEGQASGENGSSDEGAKTVQGPNPESSPQEVAAEDINIDVKVYHEEPEKRPVCVWPWAGMAINPNGSVSPCCSIEEDIYDFGNIFEKGFRKLWNNPNYQRARRHVRDYVNHRTDVKTRSEHACERCFSVGRSNFTFQPWWRFEQYDWWWGINGAERPSARNGG